MQLPISVDGDRKADLYFYPQLDLEIETPSGSVVRSPQRDHYQMGQKIDLTAQLLPQRAMLQLNFSETAWNQVRNVPVRIRGDAPFHFYRRGNSTPLAVGGSAIVPGVGRCTASAPDNLYAPGTHAPGTLRVFCESVSQIPPTELKVRLDPVDRDITYMLNSSMPYAPGPHENWLSPINRAQAFFPVKTFLRPEEQRQISDDRLFAAKVEITPELPAGDALATFDFPNVALSRWLVQAPKAP